MVWEREAGLHGFSREKVGYAWSEPSFPGEAGPRCSRESASNENQAFPRKTLDSPEQQYIIVLLGKIMLLIRRNQQFIRTTYFGLPNRPLS